MRVSVIIATKNRPTELYDCLCSLLAQTHRPAEIVIVDQSSDDLSEQAVRHLFVENPADAGKDLPRLIYVRDPTIAGAAEARNIGVERCVGDVVVISDDDIVLEPKFLGELLFAFAACADAVAISGIVTNYERPALIHRIIFHIFWRGPFCDERQPIYWRANEVAFANPIRVKKLGTGAMGIRRSLLKDLRLDGRLKGLPRGQDVDLCCRMSEHGQLFICPKARYIHKRAQSNRPQSHWLRQDVQAWHYLYCRNWNRGIKNRLCFCWLNIGLGTLATMGSIRRLSFGPWRALLEGVRAAREYQ